MLRKYVSLFLFYTLLFLTVTGIVLFIMPPGRVAYWTGWHFLGLDKDQWDNLHIIFGFLMVFFGIWHLTLNWRSFVSYLKGKAGLFTSREFFITSLLVLLIASATLMNLPPFKTFIDFGTKIKKSWPKPKTMPPAPHAEIFPLKKIARLVGISPERAVKILRSQGIKVNSVNEPLKKIAKTNHKTPAQIYELLLKTSSPEKMKKGL